MSGTMALTVYTPDGYMLALTLEVNAVADVVAVMSALREAKLTPEPQAAESGIKEETIVAVIRREHTGKDGLTVPVIDCYPAWKGDYGTYRFCGMYLNTTAHVEEFERRSGLRLHDMPIYDSQAPLTRTPGRRHRTEMMCRRPFVATKEATDRPGPRSSRQKHKFMQVGAQRVPPPLQEQYHGHSMGGNQEPAFDRRANNGSGGAGEPGAHHHDSTRT